MAAVASALSIVGGVVFAVAGLAKLRSLPRFRQELGDYELLPEWAIGIVAIGLPFIELAAAGAALTPSTREVGSIGLVGLLALFSAAIAVNLGRGRTAVSCACFGAESQDLSWVLIARNALLALALLFAAAFGSSSHAVLTVPGAVAALLATAAGWLIVEYARLLEAEAKRVAR